MMAGFLKIEDEKELCLKIMRVSDDYMRKKGYSLTSHLPGLIKVFSVLFISTLQTIIFMGGYKGKEKTDLVYKALGAMEKDAIKTIFRKEEHARER